MKKLSLTSLLLVITLGLTSCSNETDPLLLDDANAEAFEQKPSVQRNADGSYYLGYKTNNGIGSDITTNSETNTKSLNLFSDDTQTGRNVSEDLSLDGKKSFSLGINNTITNNKSTITIFDNDIKFGRVTERDHVESYKVTDNGDNSYGLDFTVKENIVVDYQYNSDNGFYEIHLREGDASESNFQTNFERKEGEALKVTFVNHFSTGNTGRSTSEASSTKPKLIITD